MILPVNKKKKNLTDRDYSILKFIGYEMGYATTSHVASTLFPNQKVASRRLKILREKGLLYHIERTTNNVGRSEYAYYLSESGRVLITKEKNIPVLKVAFKELAHTLLINEFIITLKGNIKKLDLTCKYLKDVHLREDNLFENYLLNNGHYLKTMYPDIVISVSNSEGKKILFFVEIERCTIPIDSQYSTSIKEKVEVMADYFDHYAYQYFNDLFKYDFQGFRYLIVTSGNDKRIKKIKESCSKLQEDLSFVWLTSTDMVSSKGVNARIWEKADINDNKKYSII